MQYHKLWSRIVSVWTPALPNQASVPWARYLTPLSLSFLFCKMDNNNISGVIWRFNVTIERKLLEQRLAHSKLLLWCFCSYHITCKDKVKLQCARTTDTQKNLFWGSRDEWKFHYSWQRSHGLVLWKDVFVHAFFVRSGAGIESWDLTDAADGTSWFHLLAHLNVIKPLLGSSDLGEYLWEGNKN